MSTEACRYEAERWLDTAKDDLDSAKILMNSGKFAHACFHAQQAAEKAVKAIWYHEDIDPWGHSIQRLIEDLQSENETIFNSIKEFIDPGRILDRFYIPTRYPNGLPDITPSMAFTRSDAESCIAHAKHILDCVFDLLRL
jgi:HEPN domain-containing protein